MKNRRDLSVEKGCNFMISSQKWGSVNQPKIFQPVLCITTKSLVQIGKDAKRQKFG
jgi:hypothetical protein